MQFHAPTPLLVGFLVMSFACGGSSTTATGGDGGAGAGGGAGSGGGGAGGGGAVAATCPVDPSQLSAANLVVATDRGAIRGMKDGNTAAFLGVPFAKAPARFTAAEKPPCWSGVRDAKAYGSHCLQKAVSGSIVGDEDCLFLNVWTPSATAPDVSRPVLFFVHGGANVIGAGNEDGGTGASTNLYEGAKLSAEFNAVVVTMNYRLGPLGFLAHPALSAGAANHASGNYALTDQVRALEWAKDNVAAFGGDPKKVLLFGESAGAMNTCMLLATPRANGLFSSALMESGSCQAPALADAEKAGAAFATSAGCDVSKGDVASCLRALSKDAFAVGAASGLAQFSGTVGAPGWALGWGANVDGNILPEAPLAAIRAGHQAKVPFAIGTNADETELFLPPIVNNCVDYSLALSSSYGSLAAAVEAKYPCTNYTFARWAMVDVTTDAMFTCPARRIARAAAASGVPVYRYDYTHGRAFGPLAALRAFHASELPFLFQTYDAGGYVAPAEEVDLAKSMGGYWSRLAAAGDPGGGGDVVWPAYTAQDETTLLLDTTRSTKANVKGDQCDFWDSLAGN